VVTVRILISLFLFFPLSLSAGAPPLGNSLKLSERSQPKEYEKIDGVVILNKKGLKITPPLGWTVQYNTSGNSLVFQAPEKRGSLFQRTIQVRFQKDPIPIDEYTMSQYADVIVEKLAKSSAAVEGYHIRNSLIIDMNDESKGILYYTGYKHDSVPMMQMHILISSATASFILSYTDLASNFEKEDSQNLDEAYSSMISAELDSPAPTQFSFIVKCAIGFGILIFLIIVFRLVRNSNKISLDEDDDFDDYSGDGGHSGSSGGSTRSSRSSNSHGSSFSQVAKSNSESIDINKTLPLPSVEDRMTSRVVSSKPSVNSESVRIITGHSNHAADNSDRSVPVIPKSDQTHSSEEVSGLAKSMLPPVPKATHLPQTPPVPKHYDDLAEPKQSHQNNVQQRSTTSVTDKSRKQIRPNEQLTESDNEDDFSVDEEFLDSPHLDGRQLSFEPDDVEAPKSFIHKIKSNILGLKKSNDGYSDHQNEDDDDCWDLGTASDKNEEA